MNGERKTYTKQSLPLQAKRKYFPRPIYYGIAWRLDQIFTEHIKDVNERKQLLEFCQLNVAPVFNRLENSQESLMHNIIRSLPKDAHFESHKYFNTKIIEVLIEDSCNTTKHDGAGDPPIITAYKLKQKSVIQGFINKRSDLNFTNRYGFTLLILACRENDIETVKLILSAYRFQLSKISIDYTDLSQNSAISYATLNDNINICKWLLEAGANPNASYTSPLYQAVKNDCSDDLIGLLISYGASVDAWIDFTGLNSLIAASLKNRTVVVELFLDAGAHFQSTWHKNKSFMAALKWDNLRVVLRFLQQSVEVVSKTKRGTNILHEVCSHGSVSLLEYFICNTSMNLNACDRYGKSAFFLAAEHGQLKCLELLHKACVYCCQPDVRHMLPLAIAIFNDHKACVEFMLGHLVYPRSMLVNTCNVLKTEYDQSEFRQSSAIHVLREFVSSCEGEHVDSLKDHCILEIRKALGQRSGHHIDKLLLPSRIKTMLRWD